MSESKKVQRKLPSLFSPTKRNSKDNKMCGPSVTSVANEKANQDDIRPDNNCTIIIEGNNVAVSTSKSTSKNSKNIIRVVPFRLCKNLRNLTTADLTQQQSTGENVDFAVPSCSQSVLENFENQEKSTQQKSRKDSLKMPRRSSLRLKLIQSNVIEKNQYANKPKSWSLKISRTVEVVDQKTESWRENKSKLLYMLSLGLIPLKPVENFGKKFQNFEKSVQNSDNFPNQVQVGDMCPVVNMDELDPCYVANILTKCEISRLEKRLQQRRKKVENCNSKKNLPPNPIDVIDLASDDVNEED